MSEDTKPIRVAILGGGLAGGALFRGLIKHKQLKVDIFESAPVFREQGQAIGTNGNGMWALEILGLVDDLKAAGAVRLDHVKCMIGHGPDTGTLVGRLGGSGRGTWISHRARFLDQMYKGVDPSALHAGKKLVKIEQDGVVTLFFEDGTTHECDILLGADGIHSKTRRYVVGNDEDAASEFSGWWTTWKLVPYEKAIGKLGPELLDRETPVQWAWTGPGAFVMHDMTSGSTMVQCIIGWHVPKDQITGNEWKQIVTKEYLASRVKGWDKRLAEGMVDLSVDEKDEAYVIALRQHKPIPSFVKGAVAVIGDAAGATTPWQGSGGGMAMEDACLLSELFGEVKSVQDAKAALLAYDHVQRPRRHRLIESSYDSGLLMSGVDPEVGLDLAKLREKLLPRWRWILDVDLVKNRDDALKFMRETKSM